MITNDSIWGNIRDRVTNDVWDTVGHGAPLNGVGGTGAGITGPGSTYIDITAIIRYTNKGTKASPNWVADGQPVSGGSNLGPFNGQWITAGGTGQADAPLITAPTPANIMISNGSNFNGVKLPPAALGNYLAITYVGNDTLPQSTVNIWPSNGDRIMGHARNPNDGIRIFEFTGVILHCPRASQDWCVIPDAS